MGAATVYGGFRHADSADADRPAICIADGDAAAAHAASERLMDAAWQRRDALLYRPEPLAQAAARAKPLTQGPELLAAHASHLGARAPPGSLDQPRRRRRQRRARARRAR